VYVLWNVLQAGDRFSKQELSPLGSWFSLGMASCPTPPTSLHALCIDDPRDPLTVGPQLVLEGDFHSRNDQKGARLKPADTIRASTILCN
jgi:hypothetical protein